MATQTQPKCNINRNVVGFDSDRDMTSRPDMCVSWDLFVLQIVVIISHIYAGAYIYSLKSQMYTGSCKLAILPP